MTATIRALLVLTLLAGCTAVHESDAAVMDASADAPVIWTCGCYSQTPVPGRGTFVFVAGSVDLVADALGDAKPNQTVWIPETLRCGTTDPAANVEHALNEKNDSGENHYEPITCAPCEPTSTPCSMPDDSDNQADASTVDMDASADTEPGYWKCTCFYREPGDAEIMEFYWHPYVCASTPPLHIADCEAQPWNTTHGVRAWDVPCSECVRLTEQENADTVYKACDGNETPLNDAGLVIGTTCHD